MNKLVAILTVRCRYLGGKSVFIWTSTSKRDILADCQMIVNDSWDNEPREYVTASVEIMEAVTIC